MTFEQAVAFYARYGGTLEKVPGQLDLYIVTWEDGGTDVARWDDIVATVQDVQVSEGQERGLAGLSLGPDFGDAPVEEEEPDPTAIPPRPSGYLGEWPPTRSERVPTGEVNALGEETLETVRVPDWDKIRKAVADAEEDAARGRQDAIKSFLAEEEAFQEEQQAQQPEEAPQPGQVVRGEDVGGLPGTFFIRQPNGNLTPYNPPATQQAQPAQTQAQPMLNTDDVIEQLLMEWNATGQSNDGLLAQAQGLFQARAFVEASGGIPYAQAVQMVMPYTNNPEEAQRWIDALVTGPRTAFQSSPSNQQMQAASNFNEWKQQQENPFAVPTPPVSGIAGVPRPEVPSPGLVADPGISGERLRLQQMLDAGWITQADWDREMTSLAQREAMAAPMLPTDGFTNPNLGTAEDLQDPFAGEIAGETPEQARARREEQLRTQGGAIFIPRGTDPFSGAYDPRTIAGAEVSMASAPKPPSSVGQLGPDPFSQTLFEVEGRRKQQKKQSEFVSRGVPTTRFS